MFRFIRIALVVVATCSACLPIASSADASFPGRNGKIAFSNFDANQVSQVFTVNPDGSGRTQLTHDQFDAVDPAWSPDGRRIAYTSGRSIFVMNADGSGQDFLTGPGNSDTASGLVTGRDQDRVRAPARLCARELPGG